MVKTLLAQGTTKLMEESDLAGEVYSPEVAVSGQKRVWSETTVEGSLMSGRQMKRLVKAERARLKEESSPMKRDTSQDVCKFGVTCREFLKTGKCGYLHRSRLSEHRAGAESSGGTGSRPGYGDPATVDASGL